MACQPSAAGILHVEQCSHCALKKTRELKNLLQPHSILPINTSRARPQLQTQSSPLKLASVVGLVRQVVCLNKSMHYLRVFIGVCDSNMGFIWFISADETLPSTGKPAFQWLKSQTS